MTAAGETVKTPWYKKWWIWAIVAAVLLIGIIGNGIRSDAEEAAQAPEPTATETVSAEPTPEPEETEPPVVEETGPTDEERGQAFEAALRESFGGQEYSEVLISDPSLWYGWISGVRVEGSYAYVTLQIGEPRDAEWEYFGESAASALSTLLPAEAFEGIDWIIVEDATGYIIDQQQPSPLR